MVTARTAGFRRLRGAGWIIALPIAGVLGMIARLVTGDLQFAVVIGVCGLVVGVAVLSLGYSLGGIWSGYWMIPVSMAGGGAALIMYVFDAQWLLALIVTGVVIVLGAFAAAISRTAEGEGGLLRLIGHFFRSLIPGQYSDQ